MRLPTKFNILLIAIFLCCLTSPLVSQEQDTTKIKSGFILGYNRPTPLYFGQHINNIAHDQWKGFELNIGASIRGQFDMLVFFGRYKALVTDNFYVYDELSVINEIGLELRYPIQYSRNLALLPTVKIISSNLQTEGKANGDAFQLGAELRYRILPTLNINAGAYYKHHNYNVSTNQDYEKHFKTANAFVFSVGAEFNTITK